MLYWEARRRLAEVRAFRALVFEYFSNTARDNSYRRTRHPLKDLTAVREQINKGIPAAVKNCYKVGQPVGVDYIHPREGIKGYINVIESLWGLDRFQIPISTVFDYLDRVIGIYERASEDARAATLEPVLLVASRVSVADWIAVPFVGRGGIQRA